ncbi:MAG: D-sedoheptulose 7-phosphate isomerase [Desulfosalsimonadaceae bacterium]
MGFQNDLASHASVMQNLAQMETEVREAGNFLVGTVSTGGKILVCGNGGSAADAQHFAAEVVGRFHRERRAMPAVSLATDTSVLTAVGNDYGFDAVFARQVEALGRPGDILLAISTSGNSANVEKAVDAARQKKIHTIGLLGKDGGRLGALVDSALVVAAEDTPRIQEAHIFVLHYLAGMIEAFLFQETD